MTAIPDPDPDPLAALPLLREAGVSVYWQSLDGRTAWVADPGTREVWISRSVPRELVLRYLIEAFEVLDAGTPSPADTPAPGPRLVHSVDRPDEPSRAPARTLHAVGAAAGHPRVAGR